MKIDLNESLERLYFSEDIDRSMTSIDIGDTVIYGGSNWIPDGPLHSPEPYADAKFEVIETDPYVKFKPLNDKAAAIIDEINENEITARDYIDYYLNDNDDCFVEIIKGIAPVKQQDPSQFKRSSGFVKKAKSNEELNEEQIEYNANPQGKNEGDCTIRALSLAYDLRYNNVKSELNSIATKNHSKFNELNTIKEFIEKHGSQKYINNEDGSSVIDDVEDFARKNRNGVYVIYCTNKTKQDNSNSFHLVAIVNGKIYDTWDPSQYYVIGAWKIKSTNYNRTVNSIKER